MSDTDPNYTEEGIRLANTVSPNPAVTYFLGELDRLRAELAGKELELSVMHRGNAPKYSPAERRVLSYALSLVRDRGDVRQVNGFAQGDHDVLMELVRKIGR